MSSLFLQTESFSRQDRLITGSFTILRLVLLNPAHGSCGKPNAISLISLYKPTIWGWFIELVYGGFWSLWLVYHITRVRRKSLSRRISGSLCHFFYVRSPHHCPTEAQLPRRVFRIFVASFCLWQSAMSKTPRVHQIWFMGTKNQPDSPVVEELLQLLDCY